MSDPTLDAIKSYLARIDGGLLKKFEAFETEFATVDWPYIQAFLALLFQQETKDAVSAAVAALPAAAASGSVGTGAIDVLTAVGAAVTGSIAANAEADAKTELGAAQAAGVNLGSQV